MYSKEEQWLLQEKYHGEEAPSFFNDLKRLKKGEPLAYIIGSIPFLGTTINLSSQPFIPRPETEFWLEKALKDIDTTIPLRCLDLFSGSGCIGVAVAHHLPLAHITFGEKNPPFVEQIKKNIALNNIAPEHTSVVKTDAFSAIDGTFDIIFANPPYIAPERIEDVGESVLAWEPHEALFSPGEGMAAAKNVLDTAPAYLVPGGTLYMEHDAWQKDTLEVYARNAGYADVTCRKDQYENWRTLVVRTEARVDK